jgi:serine/threonine protein kinase/Tol biopolymer transport system component
MSLPRGTRIGTYEVEAAIGEGGMGAVYRARDTKLGRKVAIKVLPADFLEDSDRVARFQREAQVLAALNHPHIAQIYGTEEGQPDAGQHVRALVMELVDGPTLADRILQGPMPLEEALSIARQIATALQAAHDKGIVHRDLKPSNIALTSDGNVKVLDFGLAKLTQDSGPRPQASAPDLTASPTLMSPAMMTGVGMILGTAAYMSPEQAKGRAADKRSDVWAFGCVLYEMVTGRRPFGGDDVSDTLASVLARDPDWRSLPSTARPEVRMLLERCLAKDARQRFADMSVVLFLLEGSRGEPVAGPDAPTSTARPRERYAWIAALTLVAAAAAVLAFIHFTETPPPEPASIRFSVSPPAGMTLATGAVTGGGVVSPDGRRVVFPTAPAGGGTRLAVREFDADEAQELKGTDGAIGAFWSPDSRSVGFLAGGKLQRIAVSGGPPQIVCESSGFLGGTWSKDGVIVFAPGNGALMRVSASGGTPAPVTALDESKKEPSHRHPWFLPDGQHFLYAAATASTSAAHTIYVGSLDGRLRTPVTTSDTQATYADGYVLFVRQGTLLAQPFDATRLEVTGEPVVAARELSTNPAAAIGDFSASTTGVLTFRRANSGLPTQLVWVDRAGRPLETVGEASDQTALQLSPDGRAVAISVLDPSKGSRDIWIHDFTRRVRTRFTFSGGDDWASAWSPDGRDLVYSSNQTGLLDLFRKATDGAGTEELLGKNIGNNRYVSARSHDGRFLMYSTGRTRAQTGNDIWVVPQSGNDEPQPFLRTSSNETDGTFSPDGRWVAYTSDESGREEITVGPFPGPGGKWQISTGGGTQPRWSPDGRELFFLEGGTKLMAVAVDGRGAALNVGVVRMLFEARFRTENYLGYGVGSVYDVSPDGRRFLINVVDSERRAQTPITVVTNWTSLIQ